jgi:branched-chain amino acid transport system ATP-binding protein
VSAAVPRLEVRDLRVWRGDSEVLHGVGFSVAPGGVTALIGRNGVGKTTTLRGILGLARRRGRVLLDGEDVSAEPTHLLVRRGVGYVPEDRAVFTRLTVEENLRLAMRDRRPRVELVEELFPDLSRLRRQRAGTLSGGQQQMLALARALLNHDRLLLVDEPTKGLAPRIVTRVVEVLERMAAVTTLLLVEQNLGVVARLARDVVVLAEGRVVHAGPPADLLSDPERTRLLLGVARRREVVR